MDKNYSIGLDNLDFDQFLGNYPYEQISNWNDLSKFLNINIINKLQKNIDMTLCPEVKEEKDKNNEIENEDKNNINKQIMSYDNIDFTEFYLNQPEYINSLDKSVLLEKILLKFKSPNEFLGEFQYTFILFLIGEVYEALKQWKDIFILITSSENLINKKNLEKFFCDFIEIIYNQLRLFPDDLMHDVILENNFLKRYLTNFLLYEKNDMKNFTKRQKLLKAFVEEKFGYKIKSEEERIIENYLNKDKDKNKKDKIDYYELYKDDINDDLPVIVDDMDNFAI